LSGPGVVGLKSGDDTHCASSLGNGGIAGEVGGGENDKGDEQEEEHECGGDVAPETGNEEDEGEDKPGDQPDAESAGNLIRVLGVRVEDTGSWHQDQRVGEPEATVGSECSATKHVSGKEFTDASEDLAKTADGNGLADDNVGDGDVAGVEVEQGEDESGGREAEQSEGTRIGELGGRGSRILSSVEVGKRVLLLEIRHFRKSDES